MPVGTPVATLIANELIDRLESMLDEEADFQASSVVAPKRIEDYTPEDLQIVVTRGAHDRVEDLDYPGSPPAIAWQQTFNVRLHCLPSELDTTPIDELVEAFAAAATKAIVGTSATWYTMGGNAINTNIGSYEFIQGDGSFEGVNIPIVVTYRVSETDPYTARA